LGFSGGASAEIVGMMTAGGGSGAGITGCGAEATIGSGGGAITDGAGGGA
jgi:hypothetical protein